MFGPICTGDKVIANGLIDEYREVWSQLLGVEMEARGTASAAFQAANSPGFFMIRGVPDLADGGRRIRPTCSSWREYACDAAASYAVAATLRSGPVPPSQRRPETSEREVIPDSSQPSGPSLSAGSSMLRASCRDHCRSRF